jgi:hypothetical protein
LAKFIEKLIAPAVNDRLDKWESLIDAGTYRASFATKSAEAITSALLDTLNEVIDPIIAVAQWRPIVVATVSPGQAPTIKDIGEHNPLLEVLVRNETTKP